MLWLNGASSEHGLHSDAVVKGDIVGAWSAF